MSHYKREIINLVKERLMAIPSNISFSIGDFGDFTKDQLIAEVDKESEIGVGAIHMQLQFIRNMPKILQKSKAL